MNILFYLAMLLMTSCAYIKDSLSPAAESSTASEQTQELPARGTASKVAIEDLSERQAKTLSDVEVIWQIPEKPVEGYVIKYGFNKYNLDREIKLLTTELEKFEDRRHGFVYRHVLGGIPLNQTVYVSVAAFEGEVVSRSSKIFEVRSGTTK